jgi:hypothetical protein
MARARNIKPSFFKNELLGEIDPLAGLLFISLWTLADKAGRLEDRPSRIRAETFPYRENIDINGYLTQLVSLGFIWRYEVDGNKYIQVIEFVKHQSPHSTEKPSTIPECPIEYRVKTVTYENVPLNNASASVSSHLNVLIPDSLIPESLNTDSLNPPSLNPLVASQDKPAKPTKVKPEKNEILQAACRRTWESYANAYFDRYGTEPVRNAKVNKQVISFVERIGFGESHFVAGNYIKSNNAYYVGRGHSFDCLLSDAEKLRTEWATGSGMTSTRASQIDKTQSNQSAVFEALKILEGN